MRRENADRRILPYDIGHLEHEDYIVGEETGVTPVKIVIDKSQHITNYTFNIDFTGQEVIGFENVSEIRRVSYIVESEVSKRMCDVLDEIGEVLDDPPVFEQKLGKFLGLVRELDKRKTQREIYFSDLLLMLKMALSSVECVEFTEAKLSALRGAVDSLSQKVSPETLKTLRKEFRDSGLDILKPFKSELDIKSILEEIYSNETAT